MLNVVHGELTQFIGLWKPIKRHWSSQSVQTTQLNTFQTRFTWNSPAKYVSNHLSNLYVIVQLVSCYCHYWRLLWLTCVTSLNIYVLYMYMYMKILWFLCVYAFRIILDYKSCAILLSRLTDMQSCLLRVFYVLHLFYSCDLAKVVRSLMKAYQYTSELAVRESLLSLLRSLLDADPTLGEFVFVWFNISTKFRW